MDWSLTYVLGGGPSAAGFDTAAARGTVLAVNEAAFHKAADAFFSNDHGWALSARARIEALPGERHLAVRDRFLPLFAGFKGEVWKRADERVPCTRPGVLSSGPPGTPGCSGYVALNLVAQKGARRIVLVGYDFDPVYRYFFSPEPYPRVKVDGVLASFRAVAPWYRKQGIEILNANPESRVDAFPKITHAEALALT